MQRNLNHAQKKRDSNRERRARKSCPSPRQRWRGSTAHAASFKKWQRNTGRCMVECMETDARIIAIRYYQGSERALAEDMAALSCNPDAIIIYLPQLVVLMKAVDSRKPEQWERLCESPPEADAWYVHLMAGDLKLARDTAKLQKSRPWLCFQRGMRNTRPHIIRWERFVAPPHHRNIQHRKNKNTWDS